MSSSFLTTLDSLADLKKIPTQDLPDLASEIRTYIIETVNQVGGHLASSLGTVELTIALHYLFNSPQDQIVWDVGHQAYTHKILTGRRRQFRDLRKPHGLASFPTRIESPHDCFGVGHSSTALSAATGLAIAKRLQKETGLVIAVVGDASLTSGLSMEALNHLADLNENVLLIININHVSIDLPQGKVAKTAEFQKFVEGFGLTVENKNRIIDGHNLPELFSVLEKIQKQAPRNPRTRILLVETIKGQGYPPAIENPTAYHGVSPGFLNTTSQAVASPADWSDVAGQTLRQLMQLDPKIVAICPAMASRSGLSPIMTDFPDRFFDPGIVESHALTLAAGLAANGLKPYVVIASSFLQRAYDQLIHDIALQKLPVKLLIDRTGESCDGPTHAGTLDLQYLTSVPYLQIIAPCTSQELTLAIQYADRANHGPVAIRFPKIKISPTNSEKIITKLRPFYLVKKVLPPSQNSSLKPQTAFVYLGKIQSPTVLDQIQAHHQPADIYHCQFLKPFPEKDFAEQLFNHYNQIITVEDGITEGGGFGARVAQAAAKFRYSGRLISLGL